MDSSNWIYTLSNPNSSTDDLKRALLSIVQERQDCIGFLFSKLNFIAERNSKILNSCSDLLLRNQQEEITLFCIAAITSLLTASNPISYSIFYNSKETPLPVDLNETIVSRVTTTLRHELEQQNYCGVLICVTCFSSLCLYGIFYFIYYK